MILTEHQRISLRQFLDRVNQANGELADSFDSGRMSDAKSAVYEVVTAAAALDLPDALAAPLRAMAQAAWGGASGSGDVYTRAGNAIHAIGNLQKHIAAIEAEHADDGETAALQFPGHASAQKAREADGAAMPGLHERREELDAICLALFREKDVDRLQEAILIAAMNMTNAGGGTIYSMAGQRELRCEVLRNRSLNIAMGGSTGVAIPFRPISLDGLHGQPNQAAVEAFAVLHAKSVNIADVYAEQNLDFSALKSFDAKVGHRTKSLLVVPMTDHDGAMTGVLRLENAADPRRNETVCFSPADQCLVESLAAHAAAVLSHRRQVIQLQELFESFITQVNCAIDDKSAYGAGHCMRVPALTMMLAGAVNATTAGPLTDFRLSAGELYELRLAALLHDCGKVSTPVHIADKAAKLQTVFDRIELINTRFEILKRDAVIDALRERLAAAGQLDTGAMLETDPMLSRQLGQLDEERAFLKGCNLADDSMPQPHQARIKAIAQRRWDDGSGEPRPLLTHDEVQNLTVSQGVLTAEERAVADHHVRKSIDMLSALPWPEHLRNVAEIAGSHHERLDGTGFPRGLTCERMSISAKILCIADLFEELTAQDCPYRRGKSMQEALVALGRMKQDGRIDPVLFDIFVREKVYLRYAERFLAPEQTGAISVADIPGYVP